jgi:uncharacterized protein
MSEEILVELIRQYTADQRADRVNFCWQGGEPTLLGIDFYRRVIELQREHAGGKLVRNTIQTNGILIDDEWCRFLKAEQFFVGLSVDGPGDLNDAYRRTPDGDGTTERVLATAHRLREHRVPFNTLSVIHNLNVTQPAEFYRFLTQEVGSIMLQLLPCAEPRTYQSRAAGSWDPRTLPVSGTSQARPGRPDSILTDWSVDPERFGEFLCELWDIWLVDGFGRIIIDWFDSLIGQARGHMPQRCFLAPTCGHCLVVESDGSVYSCDHFVFPEHKRGHLLESEQTNTRSQKIECDAAHAEPRQDATRAAEPRNDATEAANRLGTILTHPRQQAFGRAKAILPNQCKACPHLPLCNGGCPKHRFVKTPDSQPGLNYFCPGLKRFFRHITPTLKRAKASPCAQHRF